MFSLLRLSHREAKLIRWTPTNKASRRGVLQVVVLSEQRDDLGEDGFTHQLAFVIFGHDAWSHLNLLTHLEVAQKKTRNVDACN